MSYSYYMYGSNIDYIDYLIAQSFVNDLSSASLGAGREVSDAARTAGQSISMELDRQTRQLIASDAALAEASVHAIDTNTEVMREGFERLTYAVENLSQGMSALNANFHWAFGQLIASIGHMNDALSELVRIAKSPVQVTAYNHFEIAREAFRKGLYQEALEEVEKAINGDRVSSGYKLEWRFHQMKGTILLGFVGADLTLVDLPKSEEAFMSAARYAIADYPEDAGRARLCAGWAAYCQGRLRDSLKLTEQAIQLLPNRAEPAFQAAKISIALGNIETSMSFLEKAIDIDKLYALKAASDGDFQKHSPGLDRFLLEMRERMYAKLARKVRSKVEEVEAMTSPEGAPDTRIFIVNEDVLRRMLEFLSGGPDMPLFDMMSIAERYEQEVVSWPLYS